MISGAKRKEQAVLKLLKVSLPCFSRLVDPLTPFRGDWDRFRDFTYTDGHTA